MVIRVNLTHALATLSPRSGNGVIYFGNLTKKSGNPSRLGGRVVPLKADKPKAVSQMTVYCANMCTNYIFEIIMASAP